MILTILVGAIGLVICVGILKVALWYLSAYRILLRSKCFRGPRALPLIGSAHLFLGNSTDIGKTIKMLMGSFPSPFRIWIGPRLLFILHDPEHVKRIFTSPHALEKDLLYDIVKPWLGDGLFSAPATKWKVHRRVIQPLFSTKILESFIQVFTSKASITAEKMGIQESGREFDVHKYMACYSFDSVCETTMGVCVDSLKNDDCTYLHCIDTVLEISAFRMAKLWLYLDFIFYRTSVGKTYYKSLKYIDEYTRNVLNSAKEELQNESEIQPKKNLMSRLLDTIDGDVKFTDKDIRDEVATVIAAGYETTANVLSYTMFVLANYPDIQDKVYAEGRAIFGERHSEMLDVTLQDLNRMEYLERVLKETLRFFPPGLLVGRYLTADIDLGEYTLPAGSSAMIGFIEIHRNEEYWPNASEFNPDRFLPNHPFGPRHPYAFTPFAAGARNCIGMRYAIMSAKIIISTIVTRYIIKTRSFREAKDVVVKMAVTSKPQSPIRVSLERRLIRSSYNSYS